MIARARGPSRRAHVDAVAGTALLAAVVASLLFGWVIAIGYALPLLAAFVAAVVASFAVARRGVMIGVLVLAAANGIPGVNMSTPITRGFSGQDAASIFLIVAAFGWMLLDSSPASSDRLVKIFTRAAIALFAWWLFTVIRSVVGDGEPFSKAVGVGRDFLYFSLLLMILPRVRLGSRDLRWLAWVLGLGVTAYAAGQIATVFGLASPTWLVHTSVVQTVGGGLERVWADMTDLVVAALAVSIGAVLLARRRNVRLAGALLGALLVVSVIAQQGRARWLGLVAGILLVYVWTSGARRAGLVALARRRLRLVVGTGIAVIGAILVVSPSALTNSPFTQRAISLVADLEGSSSASTQLTPTPSP